MAAEVEMGEIDEMHSKESESVLNGEMNGDSNSESAIMKRMDEEDEDNNSRDEGNSSQKDASDCEQMEVDEDQDTAEGEKEGEDEVDDIAKSPQSAEESQEPEGDTVEPTETSELSDSDEDKEKGDEETEQDTEAAVNGDVATKDAEEEVHEIIDEDDEEVAEEEEEEVEAEEVEADEEHNEVALKNGNHSNEPIELNDSGEGECEDVMIIDEPKANGDDHHKPLSTSDDLEVIEIDTAAVKPKPDASLKPKKEAPPRRSVRNMNKQRSYIESDKEEEEGSTNSSEESDIEEVLPQDPLAMNERHDTSAAAAPSQPKPARKSHTNSSTIVVKDTKRLVEIAKSNNANTGNKKEPTLVIIDTNSILSGRGPVPVNKNSLNQSYQTLLPMAVPAQGMYPSNMRATITPIPMSTTITKTTVSSNLSASAASIMATPPVLLPTLTDDMFVVEAPSFIVPYVYEKPPVSDFKKFVTDMADRLKEEAAEDKDTDEEKTEDGKAEAPEDDDVIIDPTPTPPVAKKSGYFESPLGKFFIDIGFNLVQEYVQADLLKQQKRKRDREGGQNPTTNKTIHSLLKNLEYSKENNEPFKKPMRKCEFCNFKTESKLVMAHHLETPHTKNYVYKCNFCAHEARSPHDILFHTEAEHAVRGRLERAPSFHRCPNCPFEDNQKGKLSRHLVACMRKFKPDKNLEPPIDWEPPAKIPRMPKSRQGAANAMNVSAYQAIKTQSQQMQFLSKMQLLGTNSTATVGGTTAQLVQNPMHRGRGRPTQAQLTPSSLKQQQAMLRPSGMVYKQAIAGGGSVLMPATYQISGNQVYQVVGGQELSGRLAHPGHMAYVPNLSSATGTVTIQQNQAKNKSVHQPSISITPLPRAASTSGGSTSAGGASATSKPGDINSKNSFVICEICDGYIKDLEQLRNHMQWIHKVKIHPKMIYNRPPLNCQKCQYRFFTDQGLERHLLGSHGLVTSSMQDAANKSKDAGRCPVCGRVYQWKLLNHVARDHNMTLKPAHLSYKCTVCTATFGMYKQFENHVYSAHSVVAKRVMDKKNASPAKSTNDLMKPLKINDEITIIPQPAKMANNSKEGSPMNSRASTSKTR